MKRLLSPKKILNQTAVRKFAHRLLGGPDSIPKAFNLVFALLALALILLGLLRPWYSLPQLDLSSGEFSMMDSTLTAPFKATLVLLTLLAFLAIPFLLRKKKRPAQLLLRLCTLSCFFILTFPCFLLFLDHRMVGDAAWLQQQHDTMTWLGGDIYRAHSERSIELGTNVNAQDPPERLAVFRPPTSSLGIDRLNDWIWWIGYGPAWTQFVGKGWFLSVLGYTFLSISLLSYCWHQHIPSARRYLKKIILQSAALLLLSSLTLGTIYATARSLLRRSEAATAQGDYAEAQRMILRATHLIPCLRNDSGIIIQIGYFQWKLGQRERPECQLYEISWFAQHGYHGRGRALIDRLSKNSTDLPRHCARELSRHHLRVAINDINSSKTTLARHHLNKVLQSEPNCIQAHFHTQLANLLTHNLLANRRANAHLAALYDGYKSKNKRGVLASSYWILAQAETKAGNTQEAWQARLKSKGQ